MASDEWPPASLGTKPISTSENSTGHYVVLECLKFFGLIDQATFAFTSQTEIIENLNDGV